MNVYNSLIGDQRRRREAMDNFISDLLHSDSADISAILKVSIERGWYKRIRQVLREYENKKELEIDKICFLHYSEFLGSITELMSMKGSTEELRARMLTLNKEFNSTGQDLVQVMSEIEKAQSERDVAHDAYVSTKECLEISTIMNQIRESISQKNFHKAMLSLQQIQRNKSTSIKFLRDNILSTWVAGIAKSLLEIEMLECDNFILDIRRDASAVGTILIRRQAFSILTRVHQYRSFFSSGSVVSKTTSSSSRYPNIMSNTPEAGEEEQEQDLPITSHSLSYIYRLNQVFRLQMWSTPVDFEKCIPVNYAQCKTTVIKNKETSSKKLNKYFDKASALYYAIYAFATLDKLSQFFNHYRLERQLELDSKFEGAGRSILKYGLYASFVTLSAGLTGFFGVECMICRCLDLPTEGPLSVADIRQLWNRTCNRLYAMCLEFAITLTSIDDMLCMKEDLLLMVDTVSDEAFLGLNTDKLHEIIKSLLDRFEFLIIQRVKVVAEKTFSTMLYQAYEAKNADSYKRVVWSFGLDENSNEYMMFKDKGLKKKTKKHFFPASNLSSENLTNPFDMYTLGASPRAEKSAADDTSSPRAEANEILNVFQPTKYLFSSAVPLLLRELYLLVVKYFLYVSKIKNLVSQGEAVCNCLQLCYETVADVLTCILKADGFKDTSLAKASQIAIDASTLASSSNSLWAMMEAALIHFRWSESLNMHIPKTILASKTCMNNVATESQDFMYEILGSKVDDLITTMAFVNYMPTHMPTQCHSFIEEICDYLRVTFLCLTNLPLPAIEAIHVTCCRRVASGIIKFLTISSSSSDVNNINHGISISRINYRALQTFEIDILKLQKFADDCMVPHLRQCFNELADLIAASLSRDLLSLASDDASSRDRRMKNYPNLNLTQLADLLDKVDSSDMPVTMPGGNAKVAVSTPAICALDTHALRALSRKLRTTNR